MAMLWKKEIEINIWLYKLVVCGYFYHKLLKEKYEKKFDSIIYNIIMFLFAKE